MDYTQYQNFRVKQKHLPKEVTGGYTDDEDADDEEDVFEDGDGDHDSWLDQPADSLASFINELSRREDSVQSPGIAAEQADTRTTSTQLSEVPAKVGHTREANSQRSQGSAEEGYTRETSAQASQPSVQGSVIPTPESSLQPITPEGFEYETKENDDETQDDAVCSFDVDHRSKAISSSARQAKVTAEPFIPPYATKRVKYNGRGFGAKGKVKNSKDDWFDNQFPSTKARNSMPAALRPNLVKDVEDVSIVKVKKKNEVPTETWFELELPSLKVKKETSRIGGHYQSPLDTSPPVKPDVPNKAASSKKSKVVAIEIIELSD